MNKQELLKKLKALAEQGVGGEKLNAQNKLNELMKKYGVTEIELNDDLPLDCEFKYSGEREKKLLIQVIYKVTDNSKAVYSFIYSRTKRQCRTKLGCKATAAQKIEIDFLFDFYKKLYAKEEKIFFRAFVQKHNIFGEIKPDETPTPATDDELSQIHALMNGLSDEQPLKQIEEDSRA